MDDNEIITPYDESPLFTFLATRDEFRKAYLRGVADASGLGNVAMQLGYTEETLLAYAQFYLTAGLKLRNEFDKFKYQVERILE